MNRRSTVPDDAQPVEKVTSLRQLAALENACTRCPLYRDATQVVPGEGLRSARMMLVGEQPGDREDIEGRPFVGPAGGILDRALADARIERRMVFVTNAVKHFKHQQRGKRRLHKRPNAYEIDRCRWWMDYEREIIRPQLIVALGATAARGLLGRSVTVSENRGKIAALPDGTSMMVTIHPSALLRIRDAEDRHRSYDQFVSDLSACRAALAELGTR